MAMAVFLWIVLMAPSSAVADAERAAEEALQAGRTGEALSHFETAIRAADDTAPKARLRDRYLKTGWAEPQEVSATERLILGRHVASERWRLTDRAADQFENKGKLHAALILRRALIEMAGGDKTDAGKKEKGRIAGIVRKLTTPSKDDKAFIDKLVRAKKRGKDLLEAGKKLLAEGRFGTVLRLCQQLQYGTYDRATVDGAKELRKRTEDIAVRSLTPEEKELARAVLSDERFLRLEVVRSRHFLYLGPKKFVDAIPPRERMMLDLAYIFQSDLAAQPLTHDGRRIVVYYQETFDFGGGLAGGKLIRIGNRAIRLPIAGMLHYHELGHCIFGKGWLHHGFTEGLADFAAGFTLDALGQTGAAQRFVITARDQFVRYFLGRAVRYFDIQPYRPSAGFLFSFLPPGEAPFDWAPYRRAFHNMREAQFGSWPAREHQLMRFFGAVMATEYGPAAYDTLREWGWPIDAADAARVPDEAARLLAEAKQADRAFERGLFPYAERLADGILAERKAGWLASRALWTRMRARLAQGKDPGNAKQRLGILDGFQVLGPFHARRQTAYVVFPCEVKIDQTGEKRVRFGNESAGWKDAKVEDSGYVNLRGQGYGYPENACAFALTYVFRDRAQPARIWMGSDDGHTLYVNGRLAEKRATSRRFRFDDDFADVELRAGWNRILTKIHNSRGKWGFLMRLTARDGKPLDGLRISAGDHEKDLPPDAEPKVRAHPIVADEFKGVKASRWLVTVGKWAARNGRVRATGTQKLGLWMRFVVDPDKPKDGPANIMWLRSEKLARCDSFEATIDVAAAGKDGLPKKFGWTVDGENENDGQSGHTFVFDQNDKKLRCHWYRYDKLLYLQPGQKIKPAKMYRFIMRRIISSTGSKWTITCNDVPIFERVDAPRLPAFGFGLMTWGAGPEFESFKFARLAE